jgi:adenylate kinase
MNIILLGYPGAGKGTQVARIMQSYDLVCVATGDIIRTEITSKSQLGQDIEGIVSIGGFPEDEIIIRLIQTKIETAIDQKKGIILDGFPRTKSQAEALDSILTRAGSKLSHVIELSVNEDALVKRITGRFLCAKCGAWYHYKYSLPKQAGHCDRCGRTKFKRRVDDTEEIVRTRMQVYRNQTEPLIPYYKNKDILRTIDGMSNIETVTQRIEVLLNSARSSV